MPNSQNHQSFLSTQIPEGWSNDLDRLSDVKRMLRSQDYGLPDAAPILAEKATPRFLLESKGRYYLWNAVLDVVVKIEEPVGLEELLGCLAGTKSERIKMVDVKRVR